MSQREIYQAIVKVLASAVDPVPHRVVRALASRELHRAIGSDEYFEEIEELSMRGAIERSRGQGGKVRLLSGVLGGEPKSSSWTEPALMPCLARYLKTQFWKELDLPSSNPLCEWMVIDTSMSGTREGQWTRPDYTAICITPFRVLPFPELSVFTFELKASSAGGMQAVHQSLSHTKMSNYGYLVWHYQGVEAAIGLVERACKKHGVGLILIGNPEEPMSWEIRLDAERQSTSPVEIDQFLSSNRFTDDQRSKIRQKLAGVA
jgi:hypothetical protein